MGYRRHTFDPFEWYHVYTRGIDKQIVFRDLDDFERYKKLLYLCNDIQPVNLELLKTIPHEDIFDLPRKQSIVAIGVYCLMSNHPHILIQEKEEGGVQKFMHKIGTAYTMYFNMKYDRIGNLMVKPFRSRHVSTNDYFFYVAQYIHLNPVELFEPGWKHGRVKNISNLEEKLRSYEHSSLIDYVSKKKRAEYSILDKDAVRLIKGHRFSPRSVLRDAAEYYQECEQVFKTRPRGRPKK